MVKKLYLGVHIPVLMKSSGLLAICCRSARYAENTVVIIYLQRICFQESWEFNNIRNRESVETLRSSEIDYDPPHSLRLIDVRPSAWFECLRGNSLLTIRFIYSTAHKLRRVSSEKAEVFMIVIYREKLQKWDQCSICWPFCCQLWLWCTRSKGVHSYDWRLKVWIMVSFTVAITLQGISLKMVSSGAAKSFWPKV